MSFRHNKRWSPTTPIRAVGALLILCFALEHLLACGSWFPNRLLGQGGARLLVAPEARFVREIEVMKLVTPRHMAVVATNSFSEHTADAELADLRRALVNAGILKAEINAILEEHRSARDQLRAFADQVEAWRLLPPTPGAAATPRPTLPPGSIRVAAGLPAEFADYFRGAIAWHGGDTNGACSSWESLLKRPPSERRFRSAWAAFMLGKATWETQPSRAVKHFQQVRTLAREGFYDSLGLAASSLGWEARVELRGENYIRAFDLYLEQAAGGDATAYHSLRYAAALAVRNGARSLKPLAAHPRAQRVITAWMISGGWREPPVDVDGPVKEPIVRLLGRQSFIGPPQGGWHSLRLPVLLWLEAVEAAQVLDVESAEKLALAAYQAGEMELARRWIDRAPASPTAQWLQAKLLLRDGRVNEAAGILTKLARLFPPSSREAIDATSLATLQERLYSDYGSFEFTPAATQVLGELGALRLARREYSEALDALLRSGYWEDARYVADRVLTLDELKMYVDRRWPDDPRGDNQAAVPAQPVEPCAEVAPGTARTNIRHLLAQRLVRAKLLREAQDYFADDARRMFESYLEAAAKGRDESQPSADRAAALWAAAQIAFTSGLTIFDAPAETGWWISNGLFADSPIKPARLLPVDYFVLPPSFDEQLRVVQTSVYPLRHWYYRFHASGLAWEATRLMPDHSDETARVLWQAGTWIKYVDPRAADRFYKALVRRCPRTTLGREADRKRWFPTLAPLDRGETMAQ